MKRSSIEETLCENPVQNDWIRPAGNLTPKTISYFESRLRYDEGGAACLLFISELRPFARVAQHSPLRQSYTIDFVGAFYNQKLQPLGGAYREHDNDIHGKHAKMVLNARKHGGQ